ncbi:MAG: polysaccharide biosynthesis C-terminal domain-containing protein [Bacteroidaceae bacterium]|nr:polysaccharide biosynthesis C-terminal domain-containing protein [Bacteroidaceae bacterium]
MIQLSDHFTYGRLLRFTWPSMMMIITSSVYGVVDGVMVSNFTGTVPFAALNLIWPFVAILGATGFMFGTGGSALVAKAMGEGDVDKSRSIFSFLTVSCTVLGLVLGLAGVVVVRPVVQWLGAEGYMADCCVTYARILLFLLPAFVLQVFFQSFLVTAERPKLGMWVTVGAGVMNMVLDVFFVGVFHWGLAGAAWATVVSQCVGSAVPLWYFVHHRHDRRLKLRFRHFRFSAPTLAQTCYNGLSEFVINITLSLVSMLYMYQLLRVTGENGVAAYGVMMYFAYVFVAVFLGFSIGCAPVVSYHFGAANRREMRNVLGLSWGIIATLALAIVVTAQLLARPLSAFFVSYDAALLELTVHAFRIYSLHLIVVGFNIYASAFFTALNNGAVSALISVLRTLGFEGAAVLILPIFFGIEGIWWSVCVGEGVTLFVTAFLLWRYRRRYGY